MFFFINADRNNIYSEVLKNSNKITTATYKNHIKCFFINTDRNKKLFRSAEKPLLNDDPSSSTYSFFYKTLFQIIKTLFMNHKNIKMFF